MIKVDVISGFLGAGKTTLIQKLIKSRAGKENIALIENEFGEIGVDGAFLKDSGIEIKEINSGCICCSLVGNFEESLRELINTYNPERIIIEPSGVGKLSEILTAIKSAGSDLKINIVCTVVDGGKCKMYQKNFGEFYIDQIREANTIVISKTDKLSEQKIIEACETVKQYNPTATIITTPITSIDGEYLLEHLEENVSIVDLLIEMVKKEHANDHHHHHHHDGEECHCHDDEHHHHHHDGEECHCHDDEHHHHHDGEECHCHDDEHHHHHHEDDEECHCHGECHCGHGHHHHDADEVFSSWGMETPVSYTREELENILNLLAKTVGGEVTDLGEDILRSKGVVKASDADNWYYFDLVAGEYEVRTGNPDIIGKVCVIGTKLNEEKLEKLFLKKV